MPNRDYRYKVGLLAELIACVYLMLKGYRIVKWRYKIPVGEIDILAKKHNTYVIVEVKYRADYNSARYAINDNQKQRLCNSAKWIMKAYKTQNIRLDGILISKFNISHIENAWTE